jgi:GNAT superfamily N-acetyltransferase
MSNEPVRREAAAARVRACGPNDRALQAELYAACFKKPLPGGGLEWRYDRSPAGASLTFVQELEEGGVVQAVSGYACNPRRALARGDARTLATVGETGDVMTRPQWRKAGLFSALDAAAMAAAQAAGWPLVFGLPNRRSAHIFTRDLGWRPIGTVRVWSALLSADGRARAARRPAGRLRASLAPLDRARWRRSRARLERNGRGVALRPLEHFPEEVEQLSRAVEPGFEFMLRRDAPYLNWRFCQAPSGLHRILGAFDGTGRLSGYAVVQLAREDGVGYLVDLLAREERARDALIAGAGELMERSGAALMRASAIDGSWWQGVLSASGFVPPRPDDHLIVILRELQAQHPLTQAAAAASRWYFTDGDRDDETMG